MPKQKTHKGAAKRFDVGKYVVLFNREERRE